MKRAIATLAFTCWSVIGFAGEKNAESKLIGFWEVQKIVVNGHEDSGEAGTYWIFKKNVFKIVKRGRKPEGTWLITPKNKLTLKIKDNVILEGTFKIEKEKLTITTKEAVFTLVRRVFKTEPTAPKRIMK